MTEARKTTDSGKVGSLVAMLLVVGVFWLWQQADDAGWVWHDKLAIVIANNWSTGEYKSCSEAIIAAMVNEPQIQCSSFVNSGEPKRFMVRFYGQTYKEELKDKAQFNWRCKKNEGTDPAFTCDEQQVIRWDQKR